MVFLDDFQLPKKGYNNNAYTNKQLIREEMTLSVLYFLEVSPKGEIIEELTAYGKAELEEQCRIVREIVEKMKRENNRCKKVGA